MKYAKGQSMGMLDDALQWIRGQLEGGQFANPNQAGRSLGLTPGEISKVYKALKGTTPRSDSLMGWLEKMGARLVFPGAAISDTTREVLFADARLVSVPEGSPRPHGENYLAVPMVGEAGAGPGMVCEDKIESWVLVYAHHKSVQRRSNLIAVEIGKNQLSMVPTLHPGDIVLVDRDDFEPRNFRELFLVREPGQEGGAKVKRVTLNGKQDQQIITFSSDNVDGGYEPESRPLCEYGGLREAVIGKCVWAWTDLTGK